MKKGIVLYTSRQGSTEKYARLIADELDFNVKDARKTRIGALADYPTIIYGGGLYHNRIDGIRFILENYSYFYDQRLIIFSVGVSPIDDQLIKAVKKRNFPDYFRRAVHYRPLPGNFTPVSQKKRFFFKNQTAQEVKALMERQKNGKPLTLGEQLVLESEDTQEPIEGFDPASIASVVAAAKLSI